MSAQHEYEAHAMVRELSIVLGADKGEVGAEKYVEELMKHRGPYNPSEVVSHHSKRAIAESTSSPHDFIKKYEDLKMKNIRDVDAVTFISAEIVKAPKLNTFLKQNAEQRAEKAGVSLQATDALKLKSTKKELTSQELSELRKSLIQQSERPAALIPSEILMEIAGKPKRCTNIPLPAQPAWLHGRPYLSHSYVKDTRSQQKADRVGVGKLPEALQEQAILAELLSCLHGSECDLIKATHTASSSHSEVKFIVDSSLQPSFRDLVSRILPICTSYAVVRTFVDEKGAFEYGLVNQALVSGLDRFLKQFELLLCQLQTQMLQGSLTLSMLWFYLQPALSHFTLLESICTSINKGSCFGAGTLSLLSNRFKMLVGDPRGSVQLRDLGEAAGVPFLRMLELWLYRGTIQDPYQEFLVAEDETVQKERLLEQYNDAYWEKRYTLCRDRIPVFLEQFAEKILSTGKYLNVVRLCGEAVNCPNAKEITYSNHESDYRPYIESAYSYASQLLLDLFNKHHDLMPRLRSFKRFFLLDQGDFIVQFMDMTDSELKKPANRISEQRLESLLELAIRTSTANADPFKDDIRVVLLDHDLITQLLTILSLESSYGDDVKQINPTDLNLSGLEAFSFDCLVQWPLSLVFNRKVVFRYQMLFRHLFYMKHVERMLNAIWVHNSSAKGYNDEQLRCFAGAFHLRHKMLNLIQHLQYYMMIEVIDAYWSEFEAALREVSNVDDVLRLHMDMLNNCLKDCMLTNPNLLKTLSKMSSVCILYCNFMQRTYHSADVDKELTALTLTSSLQAVPRAASQKKKQAKKIVAQHVTDLATDGSFERTIENFDKNFTDTLSELLTSISELSSDSKLLHILYRVNYNDFYSDIIEKVMSSRPRTASL